MASFGNFDPESAHYALAFENQFNDSIQGDIRLPQDLSTLLSWDSLTREPGDFEPSLSDNEANLMRQVEMGLVNTERGEQ